jgi:hypothetical protein
VTVISTCQRFLETLEIGLSFLETLEIPVRENPRRCFLVCVLGDDGQNVFWYDNFRILENLLFIVTDKPRTILKRTVKES